ncbi:MAG TPA: phosphoribosylanthranilate isomerase [Acidobacteriaceae bacterium]|jgi:phosphoribosylanthranilate isomerase|nr:phosphoribosylanthranilate isomerase [Acidobacteriaceae bacterium]
MWIKICANTNAEDANLAAENGADAVGFVFAPSPRRVTAGQIAEFMPDLPADLTKIGIFNTQDFEEIVFSLRTAGLDGVQLHGELDFSLAENLRRQFGASFFVIQTLHWDLSCEPARAEQRLREQLRAMARHSAVDAVLLDSRTATASGGTGKTLDWSRARDVLGAEAGPLRVILAGGLHPDNVREAIHTLRPWGVDVASGVEALPGKKDPARLRGFITSARAAFAEVEKLTRRTPAVYPL